MPPVTLAAMFALLRKPLDVMFWRLYADEIRLNPQAPAACCILGMSQVWIVIAFTCTGLLAPLTSILRHMRSTHFESSIALPSSALWFLATVVLAALIATFASLRLYWRFRLTPEKAAALHSDPSYDRDAATLIAIKATGAALLFMVVMWGFFH